MQSEVYLFPASYAQQSLWFIEQLAKGSPIYNLPVAMRLTGSLHEEALAHAIQEIMRRHEILHTTFAVVEGQLMQMVTIESQIYDQTNSIIQYIDLTKISEAEREEEALRQTLLACQRPFDLEHGPLLRAILVRLDAQEHILCFCVHHIVFDYSSISLLLDELATRYNAFLDSEASALHPLAVQYADFTVWERNKVAENAFEAQLAYWHQQLAHLPVDLKLPTDRPRPSVKSFKGADCYFQISEPLISEIKALSQHEGVSLFMTLLAAFQVLLYRYSHQEDIVIGTPIERRVNADVDKLIGLFLNTLVLHANLSGSPTFKQLLKRVKDMAVSAYTHQDLPFDLLIDALHPERGLNRHPLFQTVFIVHNSPLSTDAPMYAPQLNGLSLHRFDLSTGGAVFDLLFSLVVEPEGLAGKVNYDTDLFDTETIHRIVKHYQRLLTSIVAHPDQTVDELVLLTDEEYQQVVFDWNATRLPFANTICIHELIEAQVIQTPQALAAVCGNQQLSYDDLNRQANQIAHQLVAQGIGPGSYVGVIFERSVMMLPALLGILKSGAAYVSLELSWPAARWHWILSRLSVFCVLTQQDLLPRLQALEPTPLLQHVICLGMNEIVPLEKEQRWQVWTSVDIAQRSEQNPCKRVQAQNAAYVIFTSGSTGTPKGVLGLHQPVINLIEWVHRTFRIGPQDRGLFTSALSFDLSIFDIFALLAAGATVQIATQEEISDPSLLLKMLMSLPITIWDSVPTALQQLVAFLPSPGAIHESRLRLVLLSGDWIPLYLPAQVQASFPLAEVVGLGGATEATVWSNFFPVEAIDPFWVSIPYGRPIQNAQYYILDHLLQPVPVGVPGDLYIGGLCLCGGYIECEITAARFLPDPFSQVEGARLYCTGDLARWRANGTIEFLGRLDHQIKIRGFRIELGEIETALQRHEAVQEAKVLAHEVQAGDKRLVAYLVLSPQYQETDEQQLATRETRSQTLLKQKVVMELRRDLQRLLPDYMVPGEFVVLDSFPLAQTGKIDRTKLPSLKEIYADDAQTAQSYVEPRNALEKTLTNIWVEVLAREPIGIYDNFFELGGHSLLATQVVSRVRSTFEIELSLRVLFAAPTIASMSEAIEALLLAQVETLSEEEAQSLAAQE